MFRRLTRNPARIIPLIVRTMLVSIVFAAPVMAVPLVNGSEGHRIEAPAPKKIGAGFVLMMSLQRA